MQSINGQSEKTIDIVAITILMTLQLQNEAKKKSARRKKIEFSSSLFGVVLLMNYMLAARISVLKGSRVVVYFSKLLQFG